MLVDLPFQSTIRAIQDRSLWVVKVGRVFMRFLRTMLLLMLALSTAGSIPLRAEDGQRKIKDQVQPVYPEMARNMNITGVVRLEITITAQGNVKNTKVLGGHPMLADAASKAVSRWKYEAGPEETRIVSVDFKR